MIEGRPQPTPAERRRSVALLIVLVLIAGVVIAALTPQIASADTAPTTSSGLPRTVSADPLPTVQINGVVWAEVTVGNVVYATGDFTRARPAGSAVGQNETNRGGLISFDITTGTMLAFNHVLNAAGRSLAVSPDQKTLYVGGDFTTVDGHSHGHLAAFNISAGNGNGSLKAGFVPNLNGSVLAVTATNSAVYAGGAFTVLTDSSGIARSATRLAALTTTNGDPIPSWTASGDDGTVTSMVYVPASGVIVVGGRFHTMNGGAARFGIGAISAATGSLTSWDSAFPIRNAGVNSSITALKTDGTNVYGAGYLLRGSDPTPDGNFEGTFSSTVTGSIRWIDSCHGDSYDIMKIGSVVYSASHAHDCSDIGGVEDTTPRIFHRALSTTADATAGCTTQRNTNPTYHDFSGRPCAKLLTWDPLFTAGTYTTAAGQAGWAVTGNSNYIAYGGEFPAVMNVPQYGLVRFAINPPAGKKIGPISTTTMTPNVTTPAPGSATVSWKQTYDRDNENLTYRLYRNSSTTPIYAVTASSQFWKTGTLSYTDTGQSSTAVTRYHVTVTDPNGNRTTGPLSRGTVLNGISASTNPYYRDVRAAGANNYWRLDDPSTTSVANSVSANDILTGTTVARGLNGALIGDADTATRFSGTPTGYGVSADLLPAPNTYSTELWFKTTSTAGGRLIGYSSAAVGLSPNNRDRQVWMDNAGHLLYGVNTNASSIISTGTYNDGQWHQVVATLSTAGMVLYADGVAVARNTSVTTGASYPGYWRIGGDDLTGWRNAPTSNFIAATLDEVATYPTAISAATVQKHFADRRRLGVVSLPPVRLLDTRIGNGATKAAVAANRPVSLRPLGRGGVPTTGVSAVVLNVTVLAPTASGYITAFAGANRPAHISNLNFLRGQTSSNLVIARLGTDGVVHLFNGSNGTIQLTADVTGFILNGTAGTQGQLSPTGPTRLLDTRSGLGAPKAPAGANRTVALKVTGRASVPSANVAAVVLNVTAIQPKASGYITAYAGGTTRTAHISNLNFLKGRTGSNLVVVPVGAGGIVNLYNGSAGTVQLTADITAYILKATSTRPGQLRAVAPQRVLDTRIGTGAPKARVGAGRTITLKVTGRAGVPATGVTAVVLNVAVVGATRSGFVAAYVGTGAPAHISNLNFLRGQTSSNLVVAQVSSSGVVKLQNGSSGTVDFTADITGYLLAG